MDRGPNATNGRRSRVLGNVLRRIAYEEGAEAGLVFVSPLEIRMRYMLRLHFPYSNNIAEYEALINGLRIAVELGIRRLYV